MGMTLTSTATQPRTFLPVPSAHDLTRTDIYNTLRAEGLRGRALIQAVGEMVSHIVAMREIAEYRAAYRARHTINCSGSHSTFTCH